MTLPACGEDRLLVDGKESPLPGAAGCGTAPLVLKVRGAFVTRGRLPSLPPGRHLLRARWRETQSPDVTVDVAP